MKQAHNPPPQWADRLLEWFCNDRHIEIIQGDLYELYYDRLERMPPWQARLFFIRDVLDMMRPFAWRPREPYNPKNQIDMLKNYFKTAYRGLWRRKAYTTINILGLSLSIAICLILFLTIKSEISYDTFHSKSDQIVRFTQIQQRGNSTVYRPFMPFPTSRALREDFSDFEQITEIYLKQKSIVEVGRKKLFVDEVVFADEFFLEVFDFPLVKGNKYQALKEPNTVILTQSTAQKLFGGRDPYGQLLKLENELSLKVTGIVQDPPVASHLSFDMLISFKSFTNDYFPLDFDIFSAWGFTDLGAVYAVLPEGKTSEDYQDRLKEFVGKHIGSKSKEVLQFYPQPLQDVHFDTRFAALDESRVISTNTIWGYASLGLFILLVACINFINLSTAQSSLKNKEVGIRKVIGARREQLILQFLLEAFVLTSISACIGLALSQLILAQASKLVGFTLEMNWGNDPWIWLFVIGSIVFTSLLAGFYPAFVLSAYQPIKALNALRRGAKMTNLQLRRGLVTFQFLISQTLIIATLVVIQQMNYFQEKDLGYNPDGVLSTAIPLTQTDSLKILRFKQELLNHPNIAQITLASSSVGNNSTLTAGYRIPGIKDEEWYPVHNRAADKDYLATFDLEIVAGKNIENKIKETKGVIVNEALVKDAGLKSPQEAIGKNIAASWGVGNAKIIGVVKDFHHQSLQNKLAPCIIAYAPEYFWQACIRLKSGKNISATLADIEKKYLEAFPAQIFSYRFEDERLAQYYQKENNLLQIFGLFAFAAIIIGSFGLFGLISFTVLQRTKEIGIRKVLGASVRDIIGLISGDFIKLMLLSMLIASPIAYLIMQSWLEEFAYRIDIPWWVFLVAGLLSLGITIGTIFYQTLKAALSNPIEALRYE